MIIDLLVHLCFVEGRVESGIAFGGVGVVVGVLMVPVATAVNKILKKDINILYFVLPAVIASVNVIPAIATPYLIKNYPDKVSLYINKKTASYLNGGLPQRMDELTTLYHVTASKDGITYHYTIDLVVSDVEEDVMAFTDDLKAVVRKNACASPSLRPDIDNGKIYGYDYKDANGNGVVAFNVDKASCQEYGQ